MTSTTGPRIEVRRVTESGDLENVFEIRRRVFLIEQKVPADEEFDEDDKRALHVLAVADDEPVGTGRLVFRQDHGRVGRMAVLAQHRSHGIGRAILQELLRAAAEHNVRRIVLHAQVHAIGFYESLGFLASGEVFDEAGIPHRRMERVL
jgi:predicted GNAT family N-acyltransferase